MGEYFFAVAGALWLGVLTSISPCPLATNIAAISYIGRRLGDAKAVFWTGLLYTVGRTAAYLAIAWILVAGLSADTDVSLLLQKYMTKFLGPILILIAMFLLNMISISFGGGVSEKMQKRVDTLGVWGGLLLGIVFALSFCPVSAGLFFGMIPIAVKMHSSIVLPTVYGVGTALPVIVFAGIIAFSAQSLGKAFAQLTKIEWWARQITGWFFMLIGIEYTLKYIFEVRWLDWIPL